MVPKVVTVMGVMGKGLLSGGIVDSDSLGANCEQDGHDFGFCSVLSCSWAGLGIYGLMDCSVEPEIGISRNQTQPLVRMGQEENSVPERV